jgi:IrrE N-terminal-like domain
VAESNDPIDLGPVVESLRREARFLAGWLVPQPEAEQLLADRLGLDGPRLQRLLLSRAPRPQHYADDVAVIADAIGVDAVALAAGLREAAAIATLSQARAPVVLGRAADDGVLAAALDTVDDQPAPASEQADRLRRLAARLWASTPPAVQAELDVEAVAAWSLTVAVVTLPDLDLPGVSRWLADRGVPITITEPIPLRGLLVAWRGTGVVFVDGRLSEAERRFTLGHELGHFVIDYHEPRQRLLREAPELMEVMDGHRPVDPSDRARALLARVPLGLHAHLLDRDVDGGTTIDVASVEDAASHFALELLAPWPDLLATMRGAGPGRGEGYEDHVARMVQAIGDRFRLPPGPARLRAGQGLEALGVRRSFFER